jgi:hypothetical protein
MPNAAAAPIGLWNWELLGDWILECGACSLGLPEKPAGINVSSQATGRYSTQIVNASRVWAVIQSRRSCPARIRPAPRRRRAITGSLLLANDCARQRASRRACSCANRRGSNVASRRTPNDCAGRSAPCRSLTDRRVTGA